MFRRRYLVRRLILGLAVAAIAAPAAQALDRAELADKLGIAAQDVPVRPDDRADRGIGSAELIQAPVRPDDRADRRSWRPVETAVPSPTRIVERTGFDWADAGVGAAAGFGLVLLAGGVLVADRRRRGGLATG